MSYRVFYSADCQLYGVEQLTTDYQGTRWTQALPPKNCGGRRGQSAYTAYAKVAERWIEQLTKPTNGHGRKSRI